jgi:hypothetical protein
MGNNDEHIMFAEVFLRLIVDLMINLEDVCVVSVGLVENLFALDSGVLAVKQVAVDTGTKLAQSLKHDVDLHHGLLTGRVAHGGAED